MMKNKTNKLVSTLLTLALVFGLFAATPIAASAMTAMQLRTHITGFDPGPGSTNNLDVFMITGRPFVIVTGSVTGATNPLELNIDAELTVQWAANYSGSTSNDLITLDGRGTFTVAENGSVTQNGSGNAINAIGANSTVKVDGGTVSATGTTAISISQESVTVNVIDGTVSSVGNSAIDTTIAGTTVNVSGGNVTSKNSIAIRAGAATVNVSGGWVSSVSHRAINLDNGATLNMSGGIVSSSVTPAIRSSNDNVTINVQKGLVVGCGTGITGSASGSVIEHSNGGSATVGGSAVVIAWNRDAGNREYIEGTINDLTIKPDGYARWGKSGDQSGIAYTDGTLHAFFPIEGVTVNAKELAAPSGLTATAGESGIALSWVDNSDTADGFQIHRKEGSGVWDWMLPLVTSETTYLDEDAEVGKTYTYRVAAFEMADGTVSDFSNEATATMAAAPPEDLPTEDMPPEDLPPPDVPFPFTDVLPSDWFYSDVKIAWEMGLVNGTTDTTYSPYNDLLYSEAVKLAACMHEYYMTGSVTLVNSVPLWYMSFIEYALDNGIINSAADYDWGAKATRAGYMAIFANALPDEAFTSKNSVSDGSIPDVPMSHPRSAAIYKLYRAGIVQGVDDDRNCLPDNNILRSEVAAIITRMMLPTERISFTLG